MFQNEKLMTLLSAIDIYVFNIIAWVIIEMHALSLVEECVISRCNHLG